MVPVISEAQNSAHSPVREFPGTWHDHPSPAGATINAVDLKANLLAAAARFEEVVVDLNSRHENPWIGEIQDSILRMLKVSLVPTSATSPAEPLPSSILETAPTAKWGASFVISSSVAWHVRG
jgi:hypothetical protein